MIPLAEKMRPKSLEDFVGQKQLSLLYEMINNDAVSSMIFWGPPGVGKTTLAKIIARKMQLNTQREMLKMVKDFINDPANDHSIIPFGEIGRAHV